MKGLSGRVPAGVVSVVEALSGAGHRTLLAGGCVRDLVLGIPVEDYDVATAAETAAVLSLFPQADRAGERFGSVALAVDGGRVEITTFRSEGPYVDGRHPEWVRPATDEIEDARRRDFTVNALYLDVVKDEVLDPTGGLADLRVGVLRAVGDPAVRLEEDSIRLLRAVRFAARFSLRLDPSLEAALRTSAAGLGRLSGDRIRSELTRLMTQPNAGAGLLLLVELGLAKVVLPEVAALKGVPQPREFHPEGDVLTHTALLLDRLGRKTGVLVWAALLHDIGKPATLEFAPDRIRFSGHDRLSARMAREVLARLSAPASLTEAVCEVVDLHIWIASLPQMRDGKRNAFLLRPNIEDHLAFHEADCLASHGDLSILRFAREAMERLPPAAGTRLVTGEDVLALGLPPGPAVGEALRAVEEAVLEGRAADRAAALELLREVVARMVKGGDLGGR